MQVFELSVDNKSDKYINLLDIFTFCYSVLTSSTWQFHVFAAVSPTLIPAQKTWPSATFRQMLNQIRCSKNSVPFKIIIELLLSCSFIMYVINYWAVTVGIYISLHKLLG